MNRRVFLVLALATLAGCSVVIGESFSGYTVAPSDASAESGSDGGGDGAMGHCAPACTGDHVVCDPADNVCKLDGTTSHVGDLCLHDAQCGSAPYAKCFDEASTAFPGGYCTVSTCSESSPCPIGATCAVLGGGDSACYKSCDSNADCRSPSYDCIDIDPLYVSGGRHKVCSPRLGCYSAMNCPTVKPTCTATDAGPGFCQ